MELGTYCTSWLHIQVACVALRAYHHFSHCPVADTTGKDMPPSGLGSNPGPKVLATSATAESFGDFRYQSILLNHSNNPQTLLKRRSSMKTLIKISVLLLASALSIAQASEVSPYLEASTVAVAKVDLELLDVPQTLATISQLAPGLIPEQLQGQVKMLGGGLVGVLRSSGVKQVYISLSTLEIPHLRPSIFVPTAKADSAIEALQAIMALLPQDLGYELAQVDDGLLIAPDDVLQRLKLRPSAPRPELEQALSGDPATLTLALGLRHDLRQSVVNLLPDVLPSGLPIAFSPKQVFSDLHSLSIQVAAPKLSVSARIYASDGPAAQRLQGLGQQYLQLVLPDAQIAAHDRIVSLELDSQSLSALLPAVTRAGASSAGSAWESNNLKQVMLGMHNFQDAYRGFPPRMTVGEDGTPLLSWRVHLLPFFDQQALYDQFHLDEPWDSPHNIKLLEKIPYTYQSREFADLKLGYTCVELPLCDGSFWSGEKEGLMGLQDITDGTSNTIAVVAAPRDKAVPWTKPEDLAVDTDDPVASLFGDRPTMLRALFDGSVRSMDRSRVTPQSLLAHLTHQGGEVGPLEK